MPFSPKCRKEIEELGKTGQSICPTCGLVNISSSPIQDENSKVNYCMYCGKELPLDATFCHNCGKPIKKAAKPLTPSIPIEKISKPSKAWYLLPVLLTWIGSIIGYFALKNRDKKMAKNIAILGVVISFIWIGIILATPTPESTTTANPPPIPTSTPLTDQTTSETLVIESPKINSIVGKSFTIEFDEQPVKITFVSVSIEKAKRLTFTWKGSKYMEADEGYKFVIFQINVENQGIREVDAFPSFIYPLDKWELEIDKGYIYEAELQPSHLSIRPEEIIDDYIVFEILENTNPIELRYFNEYDHLLFRSGPTPTPSELIVLEAYKWDKATLELHLKNAGTSDAVVEEVYVAGNKCDLTDVSLPTQETENAIVRPPGSFNEGVAYTVKVVTNSGAIFNYACIYGSSA